MGVLRPIILERKIFVSFWIQRTVGRYSRKRRTLCLLPDRSSVACDLLFPGKSRRKKMFIKVKLPWNVMIPAEAMDPNGLMIQRAVLIRLLDAFASKKATKDLGYFIALKNLEEVGEGRIRETTGEIVFPVVFSGITFKMFKGEIVHGVVHKVHKSGVFLRCGPCENVYLSQYKMPGYDYVAQGNPLFMNHDMSRIQIGSTVRVIVLDIQWKEAEKEFIALASLEGNNLGPF
ncbi:hypothetical protein N665_0522s0003 [Sinapis alba]|nr:hypothetical protein N665_0522s0003 [Sinapis alba]